MRAESLSRYHLEAGIAACHAHASTPAETDWTALLELYDQLVAITDSPIAALNRAVAASRCHGPVRGLELLDGIRAVKPLEDYYLLPAAYAALHELAGDYERAAERFREAIRCPCSDPERRYLQRRLEAVERRAAPQDLTHS